MTEVVDGRVIEALREVESAPAQEQSDTLRLSKGVVLGFKTVPPFALVKLEQKFVDPPVPEVYDEVKGRKIANPNDPAYLKALEDKRADLNLAFVDTLLALGTYIESVDEGVQYPEDAEWQEEIEYVLELEVPNLNVGRYLYWLKYYVIQSKAEIESIVKRGSRSLGVAEEDVNAAIQSFQDQSGRNLDSGSST